MIYVPFKIQWWVPAASHIRQVALKLFAPSAEMFCNPMGSTL